MPLRFALCLESFIATTHPPKSIQVDGSGIWVTCTCRYPAPPPLGASMGVMVI
jgi:hypothetical protein